MDDRERLRLIKGLATNSHNKQPKGSLVTYEAIYKYYECLEDDELKELYKRINNGN